MEAASSSGKNRELFLRGSLVWLCLAVAMVLSSTRSATLEGSGLGAHQARADDAADLDALAQRARGLQSTLVALRRQIHRNPELSNREQQTAQFVVDHLRKLGVTRIETGMAHHGVVAIIEGRKPSQREQTPLVAARADMDALPVQELNEVEYRSQNPGVMHACGHDAHTACLLGAAQLLMEMRDDFSGRVMLIFQPAEEGPPAGEDGGARLLVEEGIFDTGSPEDRSARPGLGLPLAAFALHCSPDLEVGSLGFTSGTAFASVDRVRIAIKGRQTHAAYPWKGIDPVVVASEVILALQTIRSRDLDTRNPAVISMCVVRGGTRWNIIPDRVELEGTVRAHDEAVRALIRRRIEAILAGITAAAGAGYEILEYRDMTPVCVNDPGVTARAVSVLREALGHEAVVEVRPSLGGEDFAYIARETPSFYFRLGVRNAAKERVPGLHTPSFDIDEAALSIGAESLTRLLLDTLNRAGR